MYVPVEVQQSENEDTVTKTAPWACQFLLWYGVLAGL